MSAILKKLLELARTGKKNAAFSNFLRRRASTGCSLPGNRVGGGSEAPAALACRVSTSFLCRSILPPPSSLPPHRGDSGLSPYLPWQHTRGTKKTSVEQRSCKGHCVMQLQPKATLTQSQPQSDSRNPVPKGKNMLE